MPAAAHTSNPKVTTVKRRILTATLAVFLAQQWLGTAAAVAAGIAPAANAPASQHPLVDAARNGVPIVDIAPPSAAGVSNNLYSQFDVGTNGAILNNSSGNVQTQLGGWIAGNPLLGVTPAKVILNQVTSGNPSQLLGAMEVAGKTADLVIANPSGIACNGCVFINTNHATLTTGAPQFDGAGNLSGFNVTQGTLAIGANGLDAQQVERLDLDARSLDVGGGVWARQLGVVVGSANVPYGSTAATAQTGSGTTPTFAVDVSALGGMYANTIDLIATDAGLGVNSEGRLAALQGNLRLSANGDLTLANTSATGDLQLSGANTTLNGTTSSTGGSVQVNASGALANSGQIDAAGSLALQGTSVDNSGALVQRDASQSLSVSTPGLLNNTGTVAAAGSFTGTAGALANTGGTLLSNGDQSLNVSGDLDNTGGQIASLGNLAVAATGTVGNVGGAIAAANTATIDAGALDNSGSGEISAQNIAVTANTVGNQTGTLQAAQDAAVNTASLDNTGGTVSAQRNLSVNATALNNAGGTLVGDAGANITTSSSSFGGTINSTGTAALTVNGDYTNTGTVATQGDLAIQAQSITNAADATLSSGGNLTATASGDLTNAGTIDAVGSTTLAAGGTLANSGLIDSGATTRLAAQALDNTGRIYGNAVAIAANGVNNSGGAVIASRGDMAIAANTLSNTGNSTILALGNLALAGSFDPNTGAATSAMTSLLNASSTIQAGGNMGIAAAAITNRNDGLVLGTNTTTTTLPDTVVQVQGTDPATGLIDASTLGYVSGGNPVDHGRAYWVLPSTTYPFEIFGGAVLTQEIIETQAVRDNPVVTTYTYAIDDPIWAKFGVTPPTDVPTPPAGASGTQTVAPNGTLTTTYCTVNTSNGHAGTSPYDTSGACGPYWQAVDAYNTALAAAETSLDNAITAFNNDLSGRIIKQYVEYHVADQTTVTPFVQSTDPGKILVGGDLTVTGAGVGALVNADSEIIAGGNLNIATDVLDNQSTTATQTVTKTGTVEVWASDGGTNTTSNHLLCNGVNYPPCGAGAPYETQSTDHIDLNTVTVVHGTAPTGGNAPSATTVIASSTTAPVVSASSSSLSLPTSKLFQIDSAPTSPYLVVTDPAFTNQQNFLSSDYYLQQLAIDPSQWLKRYGDGFEEQQLVQDQVVALTGHNLLSGYTTTQAEYQALMNAGVAYAKEYGIAPGVSLSAQQMALVTTDMVLLTTQTVTLPDGSTQQVLVPQVYLAHPQGQDLTQGGALIAGGTVTLTTAQDLVNSGTISGSTVAANAGADLTNTGTVAGQQIQLAAGNDLKNLSGQIVGTTSTSTVDLQAGRDLLVQTQTVGATSATGSTTSLGHVATVQGGTVTLQAARDLVAQGAQIAAEGDLTAAAGRDLNVGATTTTYQFDTASQSGGSTAIQQSGSTLHGSTVTAGGNATLAAGSDLTVTASDVAAGDNATLSGQNVTIASGVNTATDATQLQWSAGHATLADTTQTAATASVSAGNNLTVQATGNEQGGGDITVTGANLVATNGQATLQAANNINVGTLALNQSSSSNVQTESHGLFGSDSSTKTATSASTANQSSTISGNNVAMAAGNDLNVTGSNIQGTGAATGAGQVSLTAGNTLNITAAADTQTAHSNSESSGGLFGSDKGQSTSDLSRTTAHGSSITGGAITLQSGSDMTLQAAQIKGSRLTAQAGVIDGQVIDPNAQLHIDAAINDLSESTSSSGHGLLTQSTASKGTVEQTLQYTTIDVPGADKADGPVKLQATGGVTVGATSLTPGSGTGSGGDGNTPTVTVDLKQQAQQLANEPGLGYLGQLATRDDVSWQKVQLASQHWDYQASGLTGVGAVIVAIAVAAATYGAGTALTGTTAAIEGSATTATTLAGTTLATTTASVTTYTATGAMLNAAFTALVTQASTALIGNGGDVGAALNSLGSSASVHALLSSIATAGLQNMQLAGGQSLNQMAGLQNLGDTGRSVASGSLSSNVVEGVVGRAVVSAGVNSALQGTSFTQGLVNSVVADTSAIGANVIGGTWGTTGTDPNAALQTLAHAGLGCAEASLTGGDCASGAAGAAAESVLGNVVTAAGGLPTDGDGNNAAAGVALYEIGAAILGATAGQAAGGDANGGAMTALNAAANNYLSHNQIAQKQEELSKAVTQEEKDRINGQYAALDAQQQQSAGSQQLGTLLGTQQGLNAEIQGCGIPTNCAADVQQSQQEIAGAILLYGGATLPDNQTTSAVIAAFGGGALYSGVTAVLSVARGGNGGSVTNANTAFLSAGEDAANSLGLTVGDQIGMLRDAATTKGNFSLGTATEDVANALGQDWVGPGYRVSQTDGRTLISENGLRQYRPPSPKPNSPYATTGVQANFQSRSVPSGAWQNNGHLNIAEP